MLLVCMCTNRPSLLVPSPNSASSKGNGRSLRSGQRPARGCPGIVLLPLPAILGQASWPVLAVPDLPLDRGPAPQPSWPRIFSLPRPLLPAGFARDRAFVFTGAPPYSYFPTITPSITLRRTGNGAFVPITATSFDCFHST